MAISINNRTPYGRYLEAANERKARAIKMLEEGPDTLQGAYITEQPTGSEYVFLTMALRGKGAVELTIPVEKYDPFKLAEILCE